MSLILVGLSSTPCLSKSPAPILDIDKDTYDIDNRTVEFNDLLTNEEEFAKFVEDHDMAGYWDEFEDVPEMKIGLPKGRETRQLNEY